MAEMISGNVTHLSQMGTICICTWIDCSLKIFRDKYLVFEKNFVSKTFHGCCYPIGLRRLFRNNFRNNRTSPHENITWIIGVIFWCHVCKMALSSRNYCGLSETQITSSCSTESSGPSVLEKAVMLEPSELERKRKVQQSSEPAAKGK